MAADGIIPGSFFSNEKLPLGPDSGRLCPHLTHAHGGFIFHLDPYSSYTLTYGGVVILNPVPVSIFFPVVVHIPRLPRTALFSIQIQAAHYRPLSSWVPRILLLISSLLTLFFRSWPCWFYRLLWGSFTTMLMRFRESVSDTSSGHST